MPLFFGITRKDTVNQMPTDNSEGKNSGGTTVPGWTQELGSRLGQLFDLFGGLRNASAIAGVTDEQLARWRDGRSKPNFFGIAELAREKRISLDWVWTGQGPMRLGETPTPSPVAQSGIDRDLLDRIHKDVEGVYRTENVKMSPGPLLQKALDIYEELVAAFDTSEERLSGLKLALHQLRRELRQTTTAAGSGKQVC